MNDAEPFDAASNKTIIYRARDAVVTIGYSGPAYVEGLPTDRWIAEKLRGQSFLELSRGEPAIAMGRAPQWLDIGQSMELLRREFSRAFRESGMHVGLYIVAGGWQTHRGNRYRPILPEIYNLPSTQDYETFLCEWSQRDWHLGPNYPVKVAWAPKPWLPRFSQLSEAEVKYFQNHLLSTWLSPRNAIQVLIETIRRKSRTSPFVGADCMCVNIPHPRVGLIEAVYFGREYHKGSLDTESGKRVTFDVGYSPWVIGSHEVVPPMLLTGEFVHQLGAYSVRLVGAPPSSSQGLTIHSAMIPQSRPAPKA